MKKFYPKRIKRQIYTWYLDAIYYPIYRFVLHKIYYFFRYDLWRGIRNLYDFFPVVWYNQNWDTELNVYRFLKKKFELVEPVLRNGHLVNGERNAKQLRICIHLLDRLIKDEYHDMVFKEHYKKWGESRYGFEPLDSCGCLFTTFNINVRNPKDKEREAEESRILYKKEEEIRKQDQEMLFNIMRRKISSWWD